MNNVSDGTALFQLIFATSLGGGQELYAHFTSILENKGLEKAHILTQKHVKRKKFPKKKCTETKTNVFFSKSMKPSSSGHYHTTILIM